MTAAIEDLEATDWDAVVIGAGPAGSIAARQIARAGARVLLVERASFPRRKVCGACLNGHALASLQRAGLGSVVPRLGGVALDHFQLRYRGRTTRLPLPDGVAVSRAGLDAALADAAADAGSAVLFETTAQVEGVRGDSRPVRLAHRGRTAVVNARVVLDAAGLGGRCLPADASPRSRVARGSRVGAGCVVLDAPASYHAGTIFMAAASGGYVGLVRVEDGSLNVAAAFETGFLRALGSPGPASAAILDEAGFPAIPGLEGSDWKGTPALTRRTSPLGDDRLFVLGDAAGYVEPFTGEGIAWALASGLAVAPTALLAIEGWTPGLVREWSSLHRRLVRRRQVVCRAVSTALRRPWLIPVVLDVLDRVPGASGYVLRRLNAPIEDELTMLMAIAGIGTAVPPHRITQADAAAITQALTCKTEDEARYYRDIYAAVGIETRHCVVLDRSDGDLASRQSFYTEESPTTRDRMRLYEREAGGLAVAAGLAALGDAGVEPGRVTHVVTVTCSGFFAPGLDVALIKGLGLSRGVARTQVGFMGCHGAINGMRVAQAYLDADPSACVLLCCAELCSLHHQYEFQPESVIANALFADGAAALVCVAGSSGPVEGYRVVATGSTLIDDTEDVMGWRIGDHGCLMTLSARVPKLIAKHLRPWLDGWLSSRGLLVDNVAAWAVHPGGPRILAAFSEATGVGRPGIEPSYRVLARYGNMSSPTVLFILDELRREGSPRPCVVLAFGPGLVVEAALLA